MQNKTQQPADAANQRLLSLDLLRGITVAGMILVNNGYGQSFEMLQHSKWNGMTPCDLVFPFFLFIMGISTYLSLSKSQFRSSRATLLKILKRSSLLFAIGLFINWFHEAVKGDVLCFDHLRIWGVMQRIALCYFCVSMFALYSPVSVKTLPMGSQSVTHRYTLTTAIILLAAYTLILIYGNGYAEDATSNIVAQTDLHLFGYEHLYHKSPVDPEGLLGTIAAVAHVLLGFYCGSIIKQNENIGQKIMGFFLFATICLFAGYLLTFGLPLNKRIWSPSYVLVTCSLAALLQAFIMHHADQRQCRWPLFVSPYSPFRVFGVNALALYVASELLAILFSRFGINTLIFNALHIILPLQQWTSLAYALTFLAINYALGAWLYHHKIFIKL